MLLMPLFLLSCTQFTGRCVGKMARARLKADDLQRCKDELDKGVVPKYFEQILRGEAAFEEEAQREPRPTRRVQGRRSLPVVPQADMKKEESQRQNERELKIIEKFLGMQFNGEWDTSFFKDRGSRNKNYLMLISTSVFGHRDECDFVGCKNTDCMNRIWENKKRLLRFCFDQWQLLIKETKDHEGASAKKRALDSFEIPCEDKKSNLCYLMMNGLEAEALRLLELETAFRTSLSGIDMPDGVLAGDYFSGLSLFRKDTIISLPNESNIIKVSPAFLAVVPQARQDIVEKMAMIDDTIYSEAVDSYGNNLLMVSIIKELKPLFDVILDKQPRDYTIGKLNSLKQDALIIAIEGAKDPDSAYYAREIISKRINEVAEPDNLLGYALLAFKRMETSTEVVDFMLARGVSLPGSKELCLKRICLEGGVLFIDVAKNLGRELGAAAFSAIHLSPQAGHRAWDALMGGIEVICDRMQIKEYLKSKEEAYAICIQLIEHKKKYRWISKLEEVDAGLEFLCETFENIYRGEFSSVLRDLKRWEKMEFDRASREDLARAVDFSSDNLRFHNQKFCLCNQRPECELCSLTRGAIKDFLKEVGIWRAKYGTFSLNKEASCCAKLKEMIGKLHKATGKLQEIADANRGRLGRQRSGISLIGGRK